MLAGILGTCRRLSRTARGWQMSAAVLHFTHLGVFTVRLDSLIFQCQQSSGGYQSASFAGQDACQLRPCKLL